MVMVKIFESELQQFRDDSEALRLLAELNDDDYKALLVWNPSETAWDVVDAFIVVLGSGPTPLAAVQASKEKLEQEQ